MNSKIAAVFLSGYTSVNLGDDLFIKIIAERYPDSLFLIVAHKIYNDILSACPNVVVVNSSSLFYRIIYKISSFLSGRNIAPPNLIMRVLNSKYDIRCIVKVGGSIFMEGEDRGKSLLKGYIKDRRVFNNKHFSILSCNFGPYITEDYKQNVNTIFSLVDDVCFRDMVSYQLFCNLPKVRYANDVVFHLQPVVNRHKRKKIGISLIDLTRRASLNHLSAQYLQKILEVIGLYRSLDYEIILMSFCKAEGDEVAVNEVYDRLVDKSSISVMLYRGEIKQALDIINELECIIASRFHAVVLGLIYQARVFPIAYNNKTRDMLSSYGIWNDNYEIVNFVKLPIADMQKNMISDWSVDVSLNRQFDTLDCMLRRV